MTDATRSTRNISSDFAVASDTIHVVLDKLQQIHLDVANQCIVSAGDAEYVIAFIHSLEQAYTDALALRRRLIHLASRHEATQ